MLPILLEGGNPDIFKRYLLTLLQEDAQFKQELLGILLQGSVLSPVKSSRKGAKKPKKAFFKKKALTLESIRGLQALFADQPSAEVILQDIKNPIAFKQL
ncbi:MAG: hypothetical protein RLZZ628_3957 [Bacteroidota bacterium]|jgi:hypothetical protein